MFCLWQLYYMYINDYFNRNDWRRRIYGKSFPDRRKRRKWYWNNQSKLLHNYANSLLSSWTHHPKKLRKPNRNITNQGRKIWGEGGTQPCMVSVCRTRKMLTYAEWLMVRISRCYLFYRVLWSIIFGYDEQTSLQIKWWNSIPIEMIPPNRITRDKNVHASRFLFLNAKYY